MASEKVAATEARRCPTCGRNAVRVVQRVFDIEPDGSPSDETDYEYLECLPQSRGCGARWPGEYEFVAALAPARPAKTAAGTCTRCQAYPYRDGSCLASDCPQVAPARHDAQAVAWMADDGTGRVIDAKAKAAGVRAGGATQSAMAAYTVPLGPIATPPAACTHEYVTPLTAEGAWTGARVCWKCKADEPPAPAAEGKVWFVDATDRVEPPLVAQPPRQEVTDEEVEIVGSRLYVHWNDVNETCRAKYREKVRAALSAAKKGE